MLSFRCYTDVFLYGCIQLYVSVDILQCKTVVCNHMYIQQMQYSLFVNLMYSIQQNFIRWSQLVKRLHAIWLS